MTSSTMGSWQPDPTGRHEHRYHDGAVWTDQVADAGVQSTDAMPPAPAGAPIPPPPAAPEASPAKKSNTSGCLIILAVVVVLLIVATVVGGSNDDDDADDLKYGSFDVCTQYVKERLKAQSTAQFPNPYEDDGEVSWAHTGDRWKVESQVDAENSFGGTVTTRFVCQVESLGDDQWRLVNLQFLDA